MAAKKAKKTTKRLKKVKKLRSNQATQEAYGEDLRGFAKLGDSSALRSEAV